MKLELELEVVFHPIYPEQPSDRGVTIRARVVTGQEERQQMAELGRRAWRQREERKEGTSSWLWG